jgi:acyl carrier protein
LTVVPGPGATVDAEELKAMLRDHLDPAVVPASVEVRDAPPEGGSDGSTTPVAAGGGPGDDRDALMELLQECARSALGAGRIDPDNGFFDAGFTSMTLMRFVSEVALRLDVEISPVLVFRFPNLNALADHLSKEP